ncbi:hypothetical protein [Sphingomonas sp.]|uniref:hypothetical protein n=1 Tax=Sphingomonas sp. TaxID=28214 RepID=UPI003BAC490B
MTHTMEQREAIRAIVRGALADAADPCGNSAWRIEEAAAEELLALTTSPRIEQGEDERFKAAILLTFPDRDFDADPLQEGERGYWRPVAAALLTSLTASPARDQGEQTVVGIIERKNATILALEEHLAEAVKALKPFADAGEYLDLETDGFMPGDKLHVAHEDHIIFEGLRFGDFEVARAALSRLTGGE